MSSAVSLPNHTFTGQAKSSKRLTSIVYILSPETDNCPSWISGRERMTVENISWSISTKECCRLGGGWTRDLLVSSRAAHPTEPQGSALIGLISSGGGLGGAPGRPQGDVLVYDLFIYQHARANYLIIPKQKLATKTTQNNKSRRLGLIKSLHTSTRQCSLRYINWSGIRFSN